MHYALGSFFTITTKSPSLSAFDGLLIIDYDGSGSFSFFFYSIFFVVTEKPSAPSVPCIPKGNDLLRSLNTIHNISGKT